MISKSSLHRIRFACPLAARVCDPSESSRRRIRVRVSSPVYHPSENLNCSRRIRVRVGPGAILQRNPVVIEFCSPAQPESMIHRNPEPVVIEFGSESAAQSIIHRKTVVIEFRVGSESAAQSILHRSPVDIEFCSPTHSRPLAVRVCEPS